MAEALKRCTNCWQDLLLSEFWRNASRPDGLQQWCRSCFGEAYRAKRREQGYEVRALVDVPAGHKRCPRCGEVKLRSLFHAHRTQADGLVSHCKACRAVVQRESREAELYGLTPEQARQLRDDFPTCPICRTDEARHIDHDHATGAVRGRLCFRCNAALGQLRDDPEIVRRAAAYLEGDVWRPTGTTPVDSPLPS